MPSFHPELSLPEVTLEECGDAAVVRLCGEHDLHTAPLVARALEPLLGGSQPVVIDLSGTTFIDSSILHVLVRARRTAEAAGVPLGLALGESEAARSVLELTHLPDAFVWAASAAAAAELLAQGR